MGLTIAVLSPFMLALVTPFLHRIKGGKKGWILALLPLGLMLYFAAYFPQVSAGNSLIVAYPWIPSLKISLSFYLDGLSLLFGILISGIGALVLIYSGVYLQEEPNQGRFYVYILAFMGSMLGLVLADNLITLFVFWELTSLSSYFLIGFNHENDNARWAALQALLVTGIGGLALLAGFIIIGNIGGSYELSSLMIQSEDIRSHPLYVTILFLILAGAFTKSAQTPFHFWLPNAMAAPTPVSTYLHSATMVKAGIYLLARLSPMLGNTEIWFYSLTIAGAVTMLLGAYMALYQKDLKLILAYSTVSILGTLTMLIGVGTETAIKAAIVLLIAHALYKAALFLVAGAVDHTTGTRDITQLSGLRRFMPITALAAGLAALSNAGLPPFLGFVGKEAFYGTGLAFEQGNTVFLAMAICTNIFLFVAAWKAGIHPFVGSSSSTSKSPHEPSLSLWIGPALLSALGLMFGLFPGMIDQSLITPAISAIAGHTITVELALWHGWNITLLLSGITILGGVVLLYKHHSFTQFFSQLKALTQWGPNHWYKRAIDGLNVLAKGQTKVLQSGYQRYYLMIIFAFLIGLEWYALRQFSIFEVIDLSNAKFYEMAIGVFIILASLTAVFSNTILSAVLALGGVGVGSVLIYALYGAPDLAITQILVETLTVVIFVLVVYRLPRFKKRLNPWVRIRDFIIAFAVGGLMTTLVLKANTLQFRESISEYFAKQSVLMGHGRNVVNVILVDFRALDTLGEITVLAISGIGVYALFKIRLRSKDRK